MMAMQFVLRLLYGTFEMPAERAWTLERARLMRADRVMLFSARGHNEPAHLDHAEVLRRAAVMREAAVEFRAAGIGVGVNNLATIGMNFSPPRKHRFPFQNLVDADGATYPETFCPLDGDFRQYLDFLYTAWCTVQPDEVWIDDDFRYKTMAAQCFCPLHLAGFAEFTGREWTREEVVAAIASDGPVPNEMALHWADCQQQGLFSAARAIADAVHRVDPDIRIGFMGITNSVPFYGSVYLHDLCALLNPRQAPLLRPEYGSYNDESRTLWNAYVPRWCCARAVGDRAELWPEMETWPYTGFNHSRRVTRMKLAWGAVFGMTSTTVNIGADAGMAGAVGEAKAMVRAIAEVIESPDLVPRGVSLEMSENRTAARSHAEPIGIEGFAARQLTRMGLPLWPEGGCGRILVGNAPYVRRESLADFAREGLILDRSAFEVLAAMERDDLLGGARSGAMGGLPVEEVCADQAANGRAAGSILSMELAIVVRPTVAGFSLPASSDYTPLGWYLDAEGQRLSPSVWSRVWDGGRLVVLPYALNDANAEYAILNPVRKVQLESLLAWAAGRVLPVRIERGCDLAVVYREGAKSLVVGLANYALDDADDYALVLPALAGLSMVSARILDDQAHWQAARLPVDEEGRLRLSGPFRVPTQQVRVIEIAR